MATIMCSARKNEKKISVGGKPGDQLQKGSGNDFQGEVSMQYLKDFIGNRKWYILRPKRAAHAVGIAEAMRTAGNNIHIGYGQECQRKTIDNVNTKVNINVDCSKIIRDAIYAATGIDVGNFTTANEKAVLEASNLFEKAILYKTSTKVYQGDVFVTTVKGHTGACIDGLSRLGIAQKPSFKFDGTDFNKVFDADFYAEKNPDVKRAFGTNATLLFNHFIKFGCNENSRWGKTIATFNVEVYANHNPDLVAAFGKLKADGGNGYKFYKHYCTNGYKEPGRRVI